MSQSLVQNGLSDNNLDKCILLQPRLRAAPLEFLSGVKPHIKFSSQIQSTSISLSPTRWVVFNLCDGPLQVSSQHVNCGWETTIPTCPIPTLPHLLKIVQGICSWLKLSPQNNILLICNDGKARCSIVAAVYLRYTMEVHHCFSGFSYFYKLTSPPVHVTANHIAQKPLLDTFLTRADRSIIENNYHNDQSSCSWLAAIVLDGLLVQDLPVLEVWSHSKCIYCSSAIEQAESCSFDETDESCVCIYRINIPVPNDFALKVYFGGSNSSSEDEEDTIDAVANKENRLIFRYIANPEFLVIGSNEVGSDKLSIQEQAYEDMLIEGNFDMSIFISTSDISPPSIQEPFSKIDRFGTVDSFQNGISILCEWLSSQSPELEHQYCEELKEIKPTIIKLIIRTCESEDDIKFMISYLNEYLDPDVLFISASNVSLNPSQLLHNISNVLVTSKLNLWNIDKEAHSNYKVVRDVNRPHHYESAFSASTTSSSETVKVEAPIVHHIKSTQLQSQKQDSSAHIDQPVISKDSKAAAVDDNVGNFSTPFLDIPTDQSKCSTSPTEVVCSGHRTVPIDLDSLDEVDQSSIVDVPSDVLVGPIPLSLFRPDKDVIDNEVKTITDEENKVDVTSMLLSSTLLEERSISSDEQQEQSQINEEEKEEEATKGCVESACDDMSATTIGEDPIFQKFFKMLKMHVPRAAIEAKMIQEDLDPCILDKNPTDKVPSLVKQIAIKDDSRFDKYFKMLKMHIPKAAVVAKMQQNNLDPSVLDMDPNLPVPRVQSGGSNADNNKKTNISNVRRKRLHWSGVNKRNLKKENNIWSNAEVDGHGGGELLIDDNEFSKLFVAVADTENGSSQQKNNKQAAEANSQQKPKVVNVINDKRAMNCDIALARVKMSHEAIVHALNTLTGKAFTVDQLISLAGFLPTKEETESLSLYLAKHKQDASLLGGADKFMIHMTKVPDCKVRYTCLTNQKNFPATFQVCLEQVELLVQACHGVKQSVRLRKLFGCILKLGNKLNEGSEVSAITMDSLLKLKDSKAFDKKTSVMQYLVQLILQQDSHILGFQQDLVYLREASLFSISSLFLEINNMNQTLSMGRPFLKEDDTHDNSSVVNDDFKTIEEMKLALVNIDVSPYSMFICTASKLIRALETAVRNVDRTYKDLLSYVGEDPELSSEQFFRTLHQFSVEMESTAQQVKEMNQLEERKARRNRELEEKRSHSKVIGIENTPKIEDFGDAMMKTAKEIMTARAVSIRKHCAESDDDDDDDV